MNTSSETEFFAFPTEITTERIRVCRDHIAKAKIELGFLINKLPEIQKKSFGHVQYGDRSLLLDSTDVMSLVKQLFSFVDTEYELRRRADKAEKKKEKKEKHLTLVKDNHFQHGKRRKGSLIKDTVMMDGIIGIPDHFAAGEWVNRNTLSKNNKINKSHARILKRKPFKQLLTNIEDNKVD